jgi:hypothetical protein
MTSLKTVIAFALILALAAAAPADVFVQEDVAEASVSDFNDDSLLQEEAANHVADLLQDGKTKDACASLASSTSKAVSDSVASAQKLMDAVPKGAQCKAEGQAAVDTATAHNTKAQKKAKDAKTAATQAKSKPVKFKDVTIADIKGNDCAAFFADPAYTSAKSAAVAAAKADAKAEGEATASKRALDDAVEAQKKARHFCACNVQKKHGEAAKAAAKANSAENDKAWKKAYMMQCVLDGKTGNACKVPPVPKVTVPGMKPPASTEKCGAVADTDKYVVVNKPIKDFASWAKTSRAQILTADFNGDGKTDAAISGPNNWGTIPVAFSNGDGTFKVVNKKVKDFPKWAATSGVKILAGDFNGDGKGDLAMTGPKGWSTIPVAFGKGDGNFDVTNHAVKKFPGWASDHPHKIAADFDGDGKTDLALAGASGWTTIPVATSAGDGTFSYTNHALKEFPGWAATKHAKVVAGDFNGDGKGDLATCGPKGWTTMPTAFGDGTGKFTVTNKAIKSFAGWCAQNNQLIAVDINGDTKDDLVINGQSGYATIPTAFSNGDGTYDVINPTVKNFPKWDSESGSQIVGGDFTGDGRGSVGVIGHNGWTTFPLVNYK